MADGKTILVVDDNKDAVELMEEILSDEGYRVVTAYSGIQAIEQAKKADVDLILLDLMMPDFTGMHVTLFLGDLPRVVPIIIVTAWDSAEFRQWADESKQVVDFIPKPIDRADLLGKVAKALA
ncbi:MAG TPA: response regulator [Myxococcota bacterium]|jgi:CheY-like chemotaxis protein|nr:response regulator [Myxococcota bacterium]